MTAAEERALDKAAAMIEEAEQLDEDSAVIESEIAELKEQIKKLGALEKLVNQKRVELKKLKARADALERRARLIAKAAGVEGML